MPHSSYGEAMSSARRLTIIAVVAVAALAANTGAAAALYRPPLTDVLTPNEIRVSQQVAAETWPQGTCIGQERIVVADLTFRDPDPTDQLNILGFVDGSGSCELALDTAYLISLTPALTCTLIVHEYGHLRGHKHTDDRHDVMFPIIREPFEACTARMPAWRAAFNGGYTETKVRRSARRRGGRTRRKHTRSSRPRRGGRKRPAEWVYL
jgi:hypothetical protein